MLLNVEYTRINDQFKKWHTGTPVRWGASYNKKVIKGTEPVTLPSYNAISFHSKEEHQAALYDACLLIVNTYNQTEMLDDIVYGGVSGYAFMKFARNIVNQIAEGEGK